MLICASPFCEIKFEPRTHNQRFHTQKCKRDVENIARRRVATQGSSLLNTEIQIMRAAPIDDALVSDDIEVQNEYLRGINKTLARENAKLKASKYEIARAVKEAIHNSLVDLKFPKVPRPTIDRRKGSEEYACAVLSDLQIGKKTLDYDVAECERKIELYGDKIIRITNIQRHDHPVKNVRVWMLGDMVEGEAIFPSQAHHLDKSLYYQVAVDGPRILVNFLRKMLANFERIHVVGVAGNHGAIGGKSRHEMHPATNADRMLYSVVQQILANEDRITWDIPSGELEGDFYTTDKIGKKTFLLFHGHQISGLGLPVAGIDKKLKGWYMDAIREKFNYALMGHFHTPTRLTVNSATAWINGTTESSNGYASEVLAAVGRPCQYLLFSHPEHGVTSEHLIYLDNEY